MAITTTRADEAAATSSSSGRAARIRARLTLWAEMLDRAKDRHPTV